MFGSRLVACVIVGVGTLAYGQSPYPNVTLIPPTSLTTQSKPPQPVNPAPVPGKSLETPLNELQLPPKTPLAPLPGQVTPLNEPLLPQPMTTSIERPWGPYPPPSPFASSSCNFDIWQRFNYFSPDYSTWQFMMGGYGSSPNLGPKIPSFDYALATIRCGWMLTAPNDDCNTGFCWYRGNYEALIELTGAGILSDYGNAFGGPSILLRRNWVQPNAKLVPYTQVGAGFIFTDAYRDQTQRAIGQSFEFLLQAQVGLRCFISENVSLDIEAGYQHISNANLAERNFGVNAIGAQIGFTYYFPAGTR